MYGLGQTDSAVGRAGRVAVVEWQHSLEDDHGDDHRQRDGRRPADHNLGEHRHVELAIVTACRTPHAWTAAQRARGGDSSPLRTRRPAPVEGFVKGLIKGLVKGPVTELIMKGLVSRGFVRGLVIRGLVNRGLGLVAGFVAASDRAACRRARPR